VDRQALESSIELIKSGQLILLSPEGTRHKGGLARPKEGVAYVAAKSDAVIIPCAIVGAENWNKDIFGLKRPRMSVTFGRPFRFKVSSSARLSREQRTTMMEEAMYQLALTIPDENLRGDYRDLSKATTETIEFVEPR
jgi:1-acyl-sn-glycerol-3-phosphate acyltransferase